MVFTFQGSLASLTIQKPQKPIQIDSPDATTYFEHNGEADFSSFTEVISDLFSALKFMPKSTQMQYEYGNPLLLLSENGDSTVAEYVDALVEFETDEAEKNRILGAYNTLIDPTKTVDERRAAANEITDYGNNPSFGAYAKQLDPAGIGSYFGYGIGLAYNNLNYMPSASTWEYLSGYDSSDHFDIEGISNIDWDAIKNIGGDKSFYQIAMDGDVDGYTDQEAFYLMCSMLESRTRVFNGWQEIFGSIGGTHTEVISNIDAFLNCEVDPHNIGILKMFFGMQSDFINTVDAYINHDTYWGDPSAGGISNELYGFSELLRSKVSNYISSLSGTDNDAAQKLSDAWFEDIEYGSTQGSGTSGRVFWDKVDGAWTSDIIKPSVENGDFKNLDVDDPYFQTNWVLYFWRKLDEANNMEVVRVMVAHMMNRSEETKYKQEKAEYDTKLEEQLLDEIAQEKAAAKRKQQFKKTQNNIISKVKARSKVSKSLTKVSKKRASNAKAKVNRGYIISKKAQANASRKSHVSNSQSNKAAANKQKPAVTLNNLPVFNTNVNKNKQSNNNKKNPKDGRVI